MLAKMRHSWLAGTQNGLNGAMATDAPPLVRVPDAPGSDAIGTVSLKSLGGFRVLSEFTASLSGK